MIILEELSEAVDTGIDTRQEWIEDARHRILLIDRSLPVVLLIKTLSSIIRILVLDTHREGRMRWCENIAMRVVKSRCAVHECVCAWCLF